VRSAGNDGIGAAPSVVREFGSVAGPGGAPAALTVGALDIRRRARDVRVTIRAGLQLAYEGRVPLGGAVRPRTTLRLPLSAPLDRRPVGRRNAASILSFFDREGFSLVAGKAALIPIGASPQDAVENAARAGAGAVIVYGTGPVPSGSLGLDEDVGIPVVGVPRSAALRAIEAIRRGADVAVAIGSLRVRANPNLRRVAPFSSAGLAFDGRVKPDLAAPGVAIATSEPGSNDDGTSRFGTVNGSSAAAAVTGGAAALLAHARPNLDAAALRSLLANSAHPLAAGSIAAQGAGMLDVGAAAAGELAADPISLALGRADDVAWQSATHVRIRNVSTRRVRVSLDIETLAEGAANVSFSLKPDRFAIRSGRTRRIQVQALVTEEPRGRRPVQGVLRANVVGGGTIRIPWVITFGGPTTNVLGAVQLSTRSFKPSDTQPALLTLRAGKVIRTDAGDEIRPVRRLDVELVRANGERLGYLARLRNLIPGHVTIGITGRDPEGELLKRGAYRLRIMAWPTERRAPASRAVVRFRIR
jgi:subtilase family protein/PA domain-containing protein